jgi:hypothetical protein
MYLKSLNGLNDLVKETDYYKNKLKPTDKGLLIDKTNIVINHIINGNRNIWSIDYFQPIPLNAEILKKQLGRNYKEIISLLIDLDIIETDNKYLTALTATKITKQTNYKITAQSKNYGLTSTAKAMEIVKVGVLTKRIEKKIIETKESELNEYLKDKKVHSKIINNLKYLTFTISDLQVALELVKLNNETEIDHYTDCFNALQDLNNITGVNEFKTSLNFFYSANNKVGRVYHYYTTIPKQYRHHLRHSDGSRLVELDLKNSQPLILMLLYFKAVTHTISDIPTTKSTNVNSDILYWFDTNKENLIKTIAPTETDFIMLTAELNMLFEEMVNGTFYSSISDDMLDETSYKELKVNVLKSFYSYPNDKLSETETIIKNAYPYFFKFIRLIKKERSNKELSHLAQIYESSIFIDKVFTELDINMFAVPVHDSILVKENDLHVVKKIITEAIVDTFSISSALALQLLSTTKYE